MKHTMRWTLFRLDWVLCSNLGKSLGKRMEYFFFPSSRRLDFITVPRGYYRPPLQIFPFLIFSSLFFLILLWYETQFTISPMGHIHHCKNWEILKHHNVLGTSQVVSGKESTRQCRRWESLGQEDPLEKGMATHSSILAWKIPWTEEPGEL